MGNGSLQGLPHRLFAEGRQVHIAATIGVDGGFGDFEEQALGWVLEEGDAAGAKFDDDVLVGFDLAERWAVAAMAAMTFSFRALRCAWSLREVRTKSGPNCSKTMGALEKNRAPSFG